MGPPPSLKDHLLSSLSALPNTRNLHVVALTSTPKRTTSLYPYTTSPPRCFQVDCFVTLSIEVDALPSPEAPSSGDQSTASMDVDGAAPSNANRTVLTSALSAHLYILPNSATSILYISKVDSSSYPSSSSAPPLLGTSTSSSNPNPTSALPLTRTLVTAFISHFLLPSSRPTPTVRVQLFARSQGQYLFPNSEKGKSGKLGGGRLCGWWKGVYEDVARVLVGPSTSSSTTAPALSSSNGSGSGNGNGHGKGISSAPGSSPSGRIQRLNISDDRVSPENIHLAYILPSYTPLEALGMLGTPRRPLPDGLEWKYEPPFSTPIPNVGPSSSSSSAQAGPSTGAASIWGEGSSLADWIPSLEDDPKTRFLDEIGVSTGRDWDNDGDVDGEGEREGDGDDGDGAENKAGKKETKRQRKKRRQSSSGMAGKKEGPPCPTCHQATPIPPLTAPLPPAPPPPSTTPKKNPKARSGTEDEAMRRLGHANLSRITPGEFWERIGFRGECAADTTGFFTLIVSPSLSPTASSPPVTCPDPLPMAGQLPPAIVDRIQAAMLNTDFATLPLAVQGSEDWISAMRQIIAGEIGQEALNKYCEGVVPAKSAEEAEAIQIAGKAKREREEEKVVTVLQPRKKKKVA